jgi:hypothetical protein
VPERSYIVELRVLIVEISTEESHELHDRAKPPASSVWWGASRAEPDEQGIQVTQ